MKRIVIFFLIIISQNYLFAQKEANFWYFGDYAGIDFNSGQAVAITDGAMTVMEGCASMSDSTGALLFYSGGGTVWNKNHVAMPNGTGLLWLGIRRNRL